MQLSVLERLLLLKSLASTEGSLSTLRIVRDLQNELSFSEEEHKKIGFVQDGNTTRWNQDVRLMKEVSIGPAALDTALATFKRLDSMGRLTLEYLPVYERLLSEKHEATSPPKLAAV